MAGAPPSLAFASGVTSPERACRLGRRPSSSSSSSSSCRLIGRRGGGVLQQGWRRQRRQREAERRRERRSYVAGLPPPEEDGLKKEDFAIGQTGGAKGRQECSVFFAVAGMEMLLSQVEQVAGLLAESRSGLVQGWDVETLQRALGWSRFFQQLSTRLHCQPGLRTAVERRLCRGRRFSLGHLRRCPQLLGLALLENRALPSPTYQCLLRSLLLPGGQDNDSFVLLARRRAAFQLLGLHLVPPPEACVEHRVPPQLRAQAQLLLSRLQEEEAIGGISFCSALLDQLPHGRMLYRVVAAALLEPPREAEAAAPLLHWLLMGDPGRLSAFCRLLPSPWVASLCSCYPELCPHYFSLLASWGNCLNYDWLRGVWKVSDLGEDQVPWQEMRDRVFCLLQEPEPLRSAIGTELNRLKAQDGDFEVRGLSVWTDLMVDVEATESNNKRAV